MFGLTTLVVTILFLPLTISSIDGGGKDEEAMNALKDSILTSYNYSSGDHYCSWSGVICDNYSRVESINWSSHSLRGHIPSSINTLTHLKSLFLQNNSFDGSFPSLSNLSSLITIDFSDNQFSTISSDDKFSGLTSLKHLSLSNNPKLSPWLLPNELIGSINLITLCVHNASLTGNFPDFLGSFKSLQILDLSRNSITGSIPTDLASLPDLVKVDISNNKLGGQVPLFRPGVTVYTFGNNLEPEYHHRKKSKRDRILQWAMFSAVLCLIILMLVFCFAMAKWFENRPAPDVEMFEVPSSTGSPIEYDYKVLSRATDNFNNQKVLGRGGFGAVYEGKLPDGTLVAVKCLNDCGGLSAESFKSEVHALSRTCHPNLVKLYGYSKSHGMLVYEYMSMSSLDKWIFESDSRIGSLTWPIKKSIMCNIAKGLCYLHEECDEVDKILHRDIKPSNVVLDDKFNAKLCDFGLAKFLSKENSSTATQASGTYGYKAPELVYHGKRTEKSDVYSYGVVVLETMFEKKNLDRNRKTNLIDLIKSKFDADPSSIADLIHDYDMLIEKQEVENIVRLALRCLDDEPSTRPSMSTVIEELEGMSPNF